MFLWALVVSWTFLNVQTAPTSTQTLFDIVKNDSRTEALRKNNFVKECEIPEEFSKSLCFAMYDVAVRFSSRDLSFKKTDTVFETSDFCERLVQAVPEKPDDESSIAFKDKAQWLKVSIEDGTDSCKKNCLINDRITYMTQVAPVCGFLLEQFTFLNALRDTSSPALSAPSHQSGEAKQNPAKSIFDADESTLAKAVPATRVEAEKTTNVELIPKPSVTTLKKENGTATHIKEETVVVITKQKVTEPQLKQVTDIQPKEVVKSTPAAEVKEVQPNAKSTPVVDVKKTQPTNVDLTPEDQGGEQPDIDLGDDPEDSQEMMGKDDNSPIDDTENKDIGVSDNPNIDAYDDDTDQESHLDNAIRTPQKEAAEVNEVFDEVNHKKIEHVNFEEDPDSNFFTYLCGVMFLCVLLYILHQNRHKILALLLEGRRGRRGRERTRNGSKAAYSKLDCNLEEAITSKKSLNGKSMDVIY